MAGGHGWNGGGWHGNGFRGNGFRGDGFRGDRFRFSRRGYPWWGWNSGYYWYPWWGGYGWYGFDDYPSYYSPDYYSSDGYGPPPGQYATSYEYLPPGGSAASYASQAEVQQIQNEVADLRAQQARKYSEPMPLGTELVYLDGHKETIQNYAIAGSTLWVLDQNHARKVPLSELNLPATKRDNEERGAEFAVPNAR